MIQIVDLAIDGYRRRLKIQCHVVKNTLLQTGYGYEFVIGNVIYYLNRLVNFV